MGIGSDRLDAADAALARGDVGTTIALLDGKVDESIRGSKLLGRAYLALREAEPARRAFAHALAIDPSDSDAWFLFAEACEGERFFDRAIEAYRRVLELRADHAEAARRLAILLHDLRRPLEALEALRVAARLAPENLDLRLRIGVVELDREQDDSAESAFDLVIERAGPQAPALLGRGIARARRASRISSAGGTASAPAESDALFALAEEDLSEASRLSAADPAPPYNLGWARELAGRRDEAESAYREALARESGHLPSLLRLAALREARGDPEGALGLYRRAEPLAFDPRVRSAVRRQIQSLRRAVSGSP